MEEWGGGLPGLSLSQSFRPKVRRHRWLASRPFLPINSIVVKQIISCGAGREVRNTRLLMATVAMPKTKIAGGAFLLEERRQAPMIAEFLEKVATQ